MAPGNLFREFFIEPVSKKRGRHLPPSLCITLPSTIINCIFKSAPEPATNGQYTPCTCTYDSKITLDQAR